MCTVRRCPLHCPSRSLTPAFPVFLLTIEDTAVGQRRRRWWKHLHHHRHHDRHYPHRCGVLCCRHLRRLGDRHLPGTSAPPAVWRRADRWVGMAFLFALASQMANREPCLPVNQSTSSIVTYHSSSWVTRQWLPSEMFQLSVSHLLNCLNEIMSPVELSQVTLSHLSLCCLT